MFSALKFGTLAVFLCCINAFCEETTKVPEWIPVMPDLALKAENVKKLEIGEEVILFGKTAKSPKDVAEFFAAAFEKSGFNKAKFNVEHINEDGNAQENMKFIEGFRIWFFNARQDKGKAETLVSVVYKTSNVPEWIPVMPELALTVENASKIDKGVEVILFGKTAKSPKDVADFFAAAFEKSGFDKSKFNVEHIAEDGNAQENMKFTEGKKIWFFSARQDKGKTETLVSLVYKALTE